MSVIFRILFGVLLYNLMAFLSDSLLNLDIYLILRKIHHSLNFLNNFQRFSRLDKRHRNCLLLVFRRHLAYENLWDRDVLILNEAFSFS